MKSVVGFYWTLPVPWAGFTELPEDPADAAAASRTIRYQRECVRRYARQNGWKVADEIVFLELQFDRVSELVRDPLKRAAARCRELDARLLAVDFTVLHGSRSHYPLLEVAEELGLNLEMIAADSIPIDGEMFDPYRHFSAWRERQREWTRKKPERRAILRAAIADLRADGFDYASIAEQLNEGNVRSISGKPHTAESVRKAMQSSAN